LAVRAIAKNTGVSVKKVKPIIDMVRGQNVTDALQVLQVLATPISRLVLGLVKSVTANAENNMMLQRANLKIIDIHVDQSVRLKRFRPRSKGRASRITRANSSITVVVEEVS
tara:strand:- start:1756 stop:2091 length:336 start_codon:yes stop_codon:yes gene_type:complete